MLFPANIILLYFFSTFLQQHLCLSDNCHTFICFGLCISYSLLIPLFSYRIVSQITCLFCSTIAVSICFSHYQLFSAFFPFAFANLLHSCLCFKLCLPRNFTSNAFGPYSLTFIACHFYWRWRTEVTSHQCFINVCCDDFCLIAFVFFHIADVYIFHNITTGLLYLFRYARANEWKVRRIQIPM